ncbi:MAG TPA: 4,5-DOPA dioxygenase extradiol [Tahibacter sp.]|nr:4,5-DOPA dioxygenase extradiol [Tahibacter sp.]
MRKQPVLFVGHGSPMNAIEDNRWSRGFQALGQSLAKPRAVLAISAHWYLPASAVTAQQQPRTIHDFGGFPPPLFDVQYPAPGDPALADDVVALTQGQVLATHDWGLDHGSWSVLRHVFPDADVPVVQLSMDTRLTPHEHVELGLRLAPLRERDVLIVASGNIVHNLSHAFRAWRAGDRTTPAWATAFDTDVAQALEHGDRAFLENALSSETGRAAHPTPEHYLPLLYAFGAGGDDAVAFPIEGFDMASLSMRCVRFG